MENINDELDEMWIQRNKLKANIRRIAIMISSLDEISDYSKREELYEILSIEMVSAIENYFTVYY